MRSRRNNSSSFSRRELTDEQFAWMLIVPLLVFAVVIVAYPLAYSFWVSLHDYYPPLGKFDYVGSGQYLRMLKDPDVQHSLLVSVRFTAEATIMCLALGLGVALLLNEAFPGRGLFRALALVPWALSEYVTAVMWRILYSDWGFFNAFAITVGMISEPQLILSPYYVIEVVALAFSWRFAPLGAFFLLAGLQTVPEDLYRAAKTDGAGPLRRLWSITLPHLRYAVLIVLVLTTMEAARTVDIFLVLTGGGPGNASEVLSYQVFKQGFLNLEIGYGAAISYFLVALVMAIAVAYFLILTKRRR